MKHSSLTEGEEGWDEEAWKAEQKYKANVVVGKEALQKEVDMDNQEAMLEQQRIQLQQRLNSNLSKNKMLTSRYEHTTSVESES